MKDTAASLLTLVIMAIGLAMIVGGPRAVRFLFAPILAGVGFLVRAIFVLLILLVVLTAALSARRGSPHQGTSTNEMAAAVLSGQAAPEPGKEAGDAH